MENNIRINGIILSWPRFPEETQVIPIPALEAGALNRGRISRMAECRVGKNLLPYPKLIELAKFSVKTMSHSLWRLIKKLTTNCKTFMQQNLEKLKLQ